MNGKRLEIIVVLDLDDDADVEELITEFNDNEVDYSFTHDWILGSHIKDYITKEGS
tara:strand:- start:675 stop:842 length:168 start_codon:yes stop_codon:yes gene_type:complete